MNDNARKGTSRIQVKWTASCSIVEKGMETFMFKEFQTIFNLLFAMDIKLAKMLYLELREIPNNNKLLYCVK